MLWRTLPTRTGFVRFISNTLGKYSELSEYAKPLSTSSPDGSYELRIVQDLKYPLPGADSTLLHVKTQLLNPEPPHSIGENDLMTLLLL